MDERTTTTDERTCRGDAWLRAAACVGRDPRWWSADHPLRSAAVMICGGCPVRDPCLREAVRTGDIGVVRGAMLLKETPRRTQLVALLCSACHTLPLITTPDGLSRYCGGARCHEVADRSRARRSRTSRLRPTMSIAEGR